MPRNARVDEPVFCFLTQPDVSGANRLGKHGSMDLIFYDVAFSIALKPEIPNSEFVPRLKRRRRRRGCHSDGAHTTPL